MSRTETLPDAWDTDRDLVFFAITARLFLPSFNAGASVLLASYDDEQVTPELAPRPIPGPTLHRPQPVRSR